jgi:hypothetical protein
VLRQVSEQREPAKGPKLPSRNGTPTAVKALGAPIMGLGLGMGIKMGNDGRFYASMGGVTMPGGSDQMNNEPSSTVNSTEEVRP